MSRRIAWVADAEEANSYSARETRILLRAMGRVEGIVPLWFAAGSTEAPHFWNGVRVFPVPTECLRSGEFLSRLIDQQRPDVVLSNLATARFPGALEALAASRTPWIHRVSPEDSKSDHAPRAPVVVLGDLISHRSGGNHFIPFLRGLTPGGAGEPSAVLEAMRGLFESSAPERQGARLNHAAHLVMRQQLFFSGSLPQVMFELTNALVELGAPTVAQEEHAWFCKGFMHREEELFRTGSPEKYQRVADSSRRSYDPEKAVTVHFSMFRPGAECTRHGVFRSLGPREVLYTTGNHTVSPRAVRTLGNVFETILAPSWHVLRPYLEAGLNQRQGAVIPHGIDPLELAPDKPPHTYPTRKSFRFLQTSFPWIAEKGFDLTIKAFSKAFSSGDDVALVLRVPRIRNQAERQASFGRVESLVREHRVKPGAPEILLIELDAGPGQRAGLYTGADCYVHPLRAEGFGITILEAMACGLPVIATPWSGPADFLSPRYAYTLRHSGPIPERAGNGEIVRFHVEPDVDHLVHLMRHVYEHRDEAKALGRLAAEVVRRDWTWKRAAAKLASVLLGGGGT